MKVAPDEKVRLWSGTDDSQMLVVLPVVALSNELDILNCYVLYAIDPVKANWASTCYNFLIIQNGRHL